MKAYQACNKDEDIGWLIVWAENPGRAKKKYMGEVNVGLNYVEYIDVRVKRRKDLDDYTDYTLPDWVYSLPCEEEECEL